MTTDDKLKKRIKRVKRLLNETILRYTDVIDYDDELSQYDVMIKHFISGELDDVFLTDATNGMDDDKKIELFNLTREYSGLCFKDGNVDNWLESVEGMPVVDYAIIAEQVLDSYDFLLRLVSVGGKSVLDQLNVLSVCDEFNNVAFIQYLRNTFISDELLFEILIDMSSENSLYDVFTDEQKAVLLNYPEGTLYSYNRDSLNITYPLLLAVKIYNDIEGDVIEDIGEDTLELSSNLKSYFNSDVDILDEVILLSDRYRDYFRKQNITLNNESMKIVDDYDGDIIQDAWDVGDEILGGGYDTPYSGK